MKHSSVFVGGYEKISKNKYGDELIVSILSNIYNLRNANRSYFFSKIQRNTLSNILDYCELLSMANYFSFFLQE